MSDVNELKELIDGFLSYRNLLTPLQESLKNISESYRSIKTDLDNLTGSFSGDVSGQLDKINATIKAQAKSGAALTEKIAEYSESGERYARAVTDMTRRFEDISAKLDAVDEIEKKAESILSRLENAVAEKSASYNLKELQKSLDVYNKNVEKISDFINKDIATVLRQNAEKIEGIRKENEELSVAVAEQGKAVAELTAVFTATSALLKKTVEGGSVNEEYLFDAFDKWAADRKVKIKKK